MVSLAVVGILITLFLAFGGIAFSKSAVGNAKELVKDIREDLGSIRSDDSSQQSPEDREVEDQ